MEPDDRKLSRNAKRARRKYLEKDEEESREVDLSALNMAEGSSNFTLEPVDFRTHPPQSTDSGLPSSNRCVDSSPSVPSTSYSPFLHSDAALFSHYNLEIGADPVCLVPQTEQTGDSRNAEDMSRGTVELGDLPLDSASPLYNFEDVSENFSRYAAEEPDADMFVEDPDPAMDERGHLYEGAPITPLESVTAIMSFMQSEHLSGVGLGRLLSLISLHLPKPNNFFKSSRQLFKLLEHHNEPVDISYFCSVCYKQRTSSSDLCDICTDANKSVCMFIHLPLAPQLQRICKRPNFLSDIEYRFTRVKQNSDNLEDIYDGKVYKAAEQQFREGDTNLTLTWNTDGLQVYNSSLMSLWPFYFVINELPPNKRFLTENMLIGGIWCGVSKPHPNLSLKRIYQDFKNLEGGISISENSVCKCFVKLICGTCDAPARAYFLNMKTHSGFFSCHLCLCFGEKSTDSDDVTVFPFQRDFAPRTLEQYRDNVQFAVDNRVLHYPALQNDERCCGIKGPTYLSYMVDNLFSSTAIDAMHCVFSGVTRQMIKLFTDKDYKDKPWSLYMKTKPVNERIRNIEPPHFLDRMPDSVDNIVHWKASMFRAFLFHFALCVFHGILPPTYFNHLLLFVHGVSLLNTSSISRDDIKQASILLRSFVEKFQILYGKGHMSHNLHMILHLAENVEHLAPLWVTNCFRFEDTNGKLLQLVHGTRHAGLQICSSLAMVTHLPLMVKNLENVDVKQFCQTLRHKWMQLKVCSKISNNMFCIGDFKPITVTNNWMLDEISQVTVNPRLGSIQTFERLYKDGMLYVSENYRRTQRVSSYVKYDSHNTVELGNIVTFVKISEPSTNYYVVLKRLQSSFPFGTDVGLVPVKHLHEIHAPNLCIDVVPVLSLKTVLFKVQVSDTLYLSEPLNGFELE